MQVPNITTEGISDESTGTELVVGDRTIDLAVDDAYIPEYGEYNHHVDDIDGGKRYIRLIKDIERIARGSPELRRYIKYLGTELNLNSCKIMDGIDTDTASIEIHHYPFTLYDLVDIVITKRNRANQGFSTIDIAREVVELHYRNLVGLVPLTKTAHQLAHSGELFIDLRHVFGNYKEFITQYNAGMTGEHIERLQRLLSLSNNPNADERNKELLGINRTQWCIGESSLSNRMLEVDFTGDEEEIDAIRDELLEEEQEDQTAE